METASPCVDIILRGQLQKEAAGRHFTGTDEVAALRTALAADVVSGVRYPIVAVKRGNITFLDVDAHDWLTPPTDGELEAHVAALRHPPDCWWVTHGKGLRLTYVGSHHRDRALAAALELPPSFDIELKCDSRHPAGAHPKWPDARCSAVHWNDASADGEVDWAAVGYLDAAERDSLLRAHGYEPGTRYDHGRCPIAGGEESDARDCIAVLDSTIFCHRCGAKGVVAGQGLSPGVFPIALLNGGTVPATIFTKLARHFVHWAHAKVELRVAYPNRPEAALREVYDRALKATHEPDAPRIDNVFNASLSVVAADGAWLDAATLAPFRVTNDTASALPGCQTASRDDHGDWEVQVSTPLRERAKNGFPLPGYTPIWVVQGVSVRDDPRHITVVKQPPKGAPVRLLRDDEAMPRPLLEEVLGRSFPGLALDALVGLVAASLCAERTSAPVIIYFEGPTGAGKGATALLAAAIFGSTCTSLRLEAPEEEWRRQIGTALLAGQRILLMDELARIPHLGTKCRRVLELSSAFTFRLLYSSSDVTLPFGAAVVLTSLSVPEVLARSPEFCRRVWSRRLPKMVPDWRETSGAGGIEAWRGRNEEAAKAANTVLTIAYKLAAEHEFMFDRLAPALGFSRPDEGGDYVDEEAYVNLYRHCRGERGERNMSSAPRFAGKSWVDATTAGARAILDRIEPADDGPVTRADRFFHLQRALEALSWNDLLHMDTPPIRFEMRSHGAQVVMRFRERGTRRGQ